MVNTLDFREPVSFVWGIGGNSVVSGYKDYLSHLILDLEYFCFRAIIELDLGSILIIRIRTPNQVVCANMDYKFSLLDG